MSIEYGAVATLARTFGALPGEVKRALGPGLIAAADIVADRIKANAAWSTRIPEAVYTKGAIGVTGGAEVGVNAEAAPEARVLELGNAGSRNSATFRHPVYGNDWWVEQAQQHFFFKSVDESRAQVVAAVDLAVARAVEIGGLA